MQTKVNLSSFVLMVECVLSRHAVQNYAMHHPFTVLFFCYGGQLTSEEMTIDLARNIFNRVPVSLNFVLFYCQEKDTINPSGCPLLKANTVRLIPVGIETNITIPGQNLPLSKVLLSQILLLFVSIYYSLFLPVRCTAVLFSFSKKHFYSLSILEST